jgi:AraC family transcriptional regulator
MSFLHTDHDLAKHFLSEAARLLDINGRTAKIYELSDVRAFEAKQERSRMQPVLIHIHANLGSRLSMACLAGLVSLSVAHFSRVFRRTMGCSPGAYVSAKRIELAQSKLQTSAEPMSEIALNCGFSDQPHFCKTFRRWAGVTPSIWRRVHQS